MRVGEVARLSVVHPDRDRPIARAFGVLLDLVPRVGARTRAKDRRRCIAPPTTDLMAEHTADDAARDHPQSRTLSLFLDQLNTIDDAAGRARAFRLANRGRGSRAEQYDGGRRDDAAADCSNHGVLLGSLSRFDPIILAECPQARGSSSVGA